MGWVTISGNTEFNYEKFNCGFPIIASNCMWYFYTHAGTEFPAVPNNILDLIKHSQEDEFQL